MVNLPDDDGINSSEKASEAANDVTEVNLIDKLLAEQNTLQTPVARFSEQHDNGSLRTDLYKHLIPLEKPRAGEQYAFQVALDCCTGCKACVVACHTLNGLDEDEAWRDVGLLEGGDDEPGFQQTVTTACHHCLEPECMHGCPVGAYEKEQDTGIVRHLDDQCIGCEYCVLKCPYDVPKYSHKRGIVRKCDMCHQRLADGEAPACVQACPTEAISIIKIDTAALREQNNFLPGAPAPDLTLPTTRYVGREVPSNATPAHRNRLVPQPAHWPLALMLVLTQAGIGLLISTLISPSITVTLAGAILFNMGMAAATLHLGKPLKAWRFFIGLKRSWLSREILAFTLFAPIPMLLTAFAFAKEPIEKLLGADLAQWMHLATKASLLPVGLAAIFTSVMIYHDTGRKNWWLPFTATSFYFTTFAFALLPVSPPLFFLLVLGIVAFESIQLCHTTLWENYTGKTAAWSPSQHQAKLRLGPLRPITTTRLAALFGATATSFVSPWFALALLLASELASRHLFFRSVYAPKMPGGLNIPQPHLQSN